MNVSLVDAFRAFGAKPRSRLRGMSAMAEDGAMVLNCSYACFGHPSRGVLRYEDKLSREASNAEEMRLLGEHLKQARESSLPIRMIVTSPPKSKDGTGPKSFHVRADLTGSVVEFDGDHFIIDFTRTEELPEVGASSRRK
jgi:hypothetical protein